MGSGSSVERRGFIYHTKDTVLRSILPARAMSLSSQYPAASLSKERLDTVVVSLKQLLSDPAIRQLKQPAVQGKAWHMLPEISTYMADLRQEEELVRKKIMNKISSFVYRFHEHTLDATLARAGTMSDARVHSGSSLDLNEEFDLLCLDSKERLYLILKQYGWLEDFFRQYSQHFYMNSVTFVDMIPVKKLLVKVKVIGLGIAGSLAVSGLAKLGIEHVTGYEQRQRSGPGSACSRYQNASWRAYDISEKLLDEEAYDHLCAYRQKIKVEYDDGTSKMVATDRVQIIIGDAVNSALNSASRYGAKLCFGCSEDSYYKDNESIGHHNAPSASSSSSSKGKMSTPSQENMILTSCSHSDDDDVEYTTSITASYNYSSSNNQNHSSKYNKKCDEDSGEDVDIVALFCGAHTSQVFEGLAEEMDISLWPELDSPCKMWLRLKETACERGTRKFHRSNTRSGEIGAEQCCHTIASARNTVEDLVRVQEALRHQFRYQEEGGEESNRQLPAEFHAKQSTVEKIMRYMESGSTEGARFDYVFTNAPINEHNLAKRDAVGEDGSVVLDGGYVAEVKLANHSVVGGHRSSEGCAQELLRRFSTPLIVTGGDACVPPNPLAAYGATLACESAHMLVQLAVAHGHLNAIIHGMKSNSGDTSLGERNEEEWGRDLGDLKNLFSEYYDARSRSENYFQWIQTLICNLYSLPKFH